MYLILRAAVLVALSLPLSNHAIAQSGLEYTITGELIDAELDEPLGFANLVVYNTKDSLIGGTTSDIDGRFAVRLPSEGTYRVEASFIGYDDVTRSFTITPGAPTVTLQPISLQTGGTSLDEVVVTAERALMELGLDRKVFNVENNIAAAGGSATDLLRNLPSVSVDLDGNVSLRGSGNVRFLINGRPSGLTSDDPAAFLASLSASNIERIEIITNPGAAFDPEGTAGMINIVLKQQRKDGLNGSVTANVGTRDKYDATLSLNYRLGKFNHFLNLSGRDDTRFVDGDRQQFGLGDSTFRREIDFGGFRQNTGASIRGGTEYMLNERGSIQLQGTYQYEEGQSANNRFTDFFAADDQLAQRTLRAETEPSKENEYEIRADYTQRFAEDGHTLGGALQYSNSYETETEDYLQTDRDPLGQIFRVDRQNAPVIEDRTEMLGQLDYTRLIGDVAFGAGWRTTVEQLRTDATFNQFLPSSESFSKVDSLSNLFAYDEQVHALYATAGMEPGKWRLSAGLRAEQAFTRSEVLEPVEQAARFDNDYFQLYPSVFTGYELSDKSTFQLNYSRRINRPRSRQLNPFIDRGDPFNLRAGNPFLLPEIINSFEANWQQRAGDATITTGAYFREKRDLISRVNRTLEGGLVSLSTSDNLDRGRDIGLEVIARYRLGEKADVTASGNLYRTQIDGNLAEGAIDVAGTLFESRLQANAELPWGVSAQATYFYRSPGVNAQGSYKTIQSLDVGLRRDILNKRGAITLRVSDVFNTLSYRFTNIVADLQTTTEYKRESRIGYLGFQYRFGIDADKKPREEQRGGGRGDDGGGGDM